MKLKLILPKKNGEIGQDFFDQRVSASLTGRRYGSAPLVLPTVAALLPQDVDVSLVDENVEPIDFEERVDMVGITFNTAWSRRAYEIADVYRNKSVAVIMGGIHASMMPEEAAQHADSVVVGEAEEILEQVMSDFRKNRLQKFYRSQNRPDFKNAPIPRWDLLKSHLYSFHTLQTSRGCPFDCDFCGVKAFYGEKYRFKPIENVIKEIEVLKRIDGEKLVFFVDDNIIANPKYAKELFKAIIPFNIRWFGQASINLANDTELLRIMHKSGCRQVFIGFESLSQQSLDSMNKGNLNRVDEYEAAIEKIHAHGICVFGSFMLGNDFDDESIFERIVRFINKTKIAYTMINILTPHPGTRLWHRMNNEGRILHRNWTKYDGSHVCFEPNLMSTEVLQKGYYWVLQRIYSYEALYKRLSSLWKQGILVTHRRRLSKQRVYFTYKALLLKQRDGSRFMLKSLWDPQGGSLSSILLGLNFHEYAFSLPKAINPKRT